MKLFYVCVLFSCLRVFATIDADARWDEFENELAWFIQYTCPTDEPIETMDKNDLESYFKQKQIQEHETLVRAINQAQKAFLEYREKTAQSFAATMGESRHSASLHSLVELELTRLHCEYFEKRLFPENWQQHYEQYLQSKRELPDSMPGRKRRPRWGK